MPWQVEIGMPLQLAVERAILEVAAQRAGDASATVAIDVGIAEFPHPKFDKYMFDLTKTYSPLVFIITFGTRTRRFSPSAAADASAARWRLSVRRARRCAAARLRLSVRAAERGGHARDST